MGMGMVCFLASLLDMDVMYGVAACGTLWALYQVRLKVEAVHGVVLPGPVASPGWWPDMVPRDQNFRWKTFRKTITFWAQPRVMMIMPMSYS